MPQRRVPHSYDEIVRRTVPDPDSSFRPTSQQEDAADACSDVELMSQDERRLYHRVCDALLPLYGRIGVEIEHERVTLRGVVPDMRALELVESLVTSIEGVGDVDSRLVVAAG